MARVVPLVSTPRFVMPTTGRSLRDMAPVAALAIPTAAPAAFERI